MSKKVTDIVEKLVNPIVDKEELELVDIEYKKEGSNWFLRVYIDKDGGVDIDDCGRVSEELSKELDEIDPIPNAYFLEVSSPGAERPLKTKKDLLKSIGKHVHITTYEPVSNQKAFEGKLISFDEVVLVVQEKKDTFEIPYEKVASARLALVF